MKLLEYEAKNILRQAGLHTPASKIITTNTEEVSLPAVIKSQVPVGGRGKAGGVKVVTDGSQLKETINSIFHLPIKGYTPKVLLAEELIDIDRELYLSIIIDRDASDVKLIAHREGGIEVEEQKDFYIHTIDNNFELIAETLAEYYELEDKSYVIEDIVKTLYRCFIKNDATLLEINPLILTTNDDFVIGDCKIELDDMAYFRHQDWNFEEVKADTNFVILDPDGDIATIANGAGLAMATVDAVTSAGMRPANFLDIGGGANVESTIDAFRKIMKYSNPKAIIINIFAGITRCDDVAKALIAARSQIQNLPPVFVRLGGTNYDKAVPLMNDAHIPIQNNLESCLSLAREVVHE